MAIDTQAGQAIYNPRTLQLYDLVVLRLSNPLIWRCPTAQILALYDRHAGPSHLDVGVGTGWYLERCRFPSPRPRVGLMDLNADSLDFTARRLARYRPETYRVDVLGEPAAGIAPFDSIGITYLLHCLPGDIAGKARAFDTVRPCLRDGGVVFGATILSDGVPTIAAARALMRIYNRKGVFSNAGDTLPALRWISASAWWKLLSSAASHCSLRANRTEKACRRNLPRKSPPRRTGRAR